MKARIATTLLLVLLCLWGNLRAQRDWSWVFGDSVLMRFPNGAAPVVDSLARTRYSFENSSSIADSAGNLLYYANADSIYRANGTRPAGGIKLFADLLTNGSLFLPVWGDKWHYFLFYASYNCSSVSICPCLSEIGFANGIDQILANQRLPEYDPINPIAEKVAAVKDAQGSGWWIIYHGIDDNKFIRFHLNGELVSQISIQVIGSNHEYLGTNAAYTLGEISFSPNGDKLIVITMTGVIDVFDFDRCSGLLSNWEVLGTPSPTYPGPNNYYGASFSPDGTKIYVSEGSEPPIVNRMLQWDLTATNVQASKTLIFTAPDSVIVGQHQLGPDGKIYITQHNPWDSLNICNKTLSVIQNPNLAGLACNFDYLGIPLRGLHTTYSLPNLPNYNLPPLVRQVAEVGAPRVTICPGDSVQVGYPDSTNGAVTYAWFPPTDISDPTSAITWAKPTATRWYYLYALDTAMGLPCGQTVDSVLVRVVSQSEMPSVSLGSDTALCAGDSMSLGVSATPGWRYLWNTGDTTALVSVSGAGAYSVTVTNPSANLHCLVDADTVVIDTFPSVIAPAQIAGADTTICAGDTARLGATGWGPGWQFAWSNGDTTAQILATSTGTYVLNVSNPASNPLCYVAADTVILSAFVLPQALPLGFAGGDSIICLGDTVMIGGTAVLGWDYLWSPSNTLSSATIAQPLAAPVASQYYALVARDSASGGGCAQASDSVHIVVEQPFTHAAPEDVSFCIGECFMLGVDAVSGMQYAWTPTTGLTSPNLSWTKAQPTASTIYNLSVTNPALQSPNCREKQFTVLAIADACNHQSFIAMNGDGIAETLNLGEHAGRVELRVYDMAGRLVFRSLDYHNDWSPTGSGQAAAALAFGLYVYQVTVVGDCPSAFTGKIVVVR